MDDEIAEAISRLLLISGGSERAKEYLEAYVEREGSTTSTPSSSGNVDSQRSPNAAFLPSPPLLPVTNPWREDYDTPTESAGPAGPYYLSPLSLPQEMQPHNGRRDSTTIHTGGVYWRADGPPNDPNRTGPSPPVTPVRAHSSRPKVTAGAHLHGARDTPPPSPAVSALSRISDQPLSTHSFSLTSSPERAGSGRYARNTAQPSPSKTHRTPGRCPIRHDGAPEVADLHPHLTLIGSDESKLSNSEFETVKSKIRADPDYVGELPYIRLLSPQYKVKSLVNSPPASGTGKWYAVSTGTAVGVFPEWGPVATATQGVTKSVYKGFPTRGEAIVAYQIMLLRGEVLLMNGNEAKGERRK